MPLKWYILGPLLAMAGGLFGILAAIHEEAKLASYFGMFVAGPAVEEVVKPSGVYLLLGKWPYALRSQRYTAFLAALSGLTFAAVENVIYLNVLIADPGWDIVAWRWTVCVLLHSGCSFIVGLGINQQLAASIRGEIPFLKGNRIFFIAPIVIHGCYNLTAYMLETRLGWFET